jgi:hypothetical protein
MRLSVLTVSSSAAGVRSHECYPIHSGDNHLPRASTPPAVSFDSSPWVLAYEEDVPHGPLPSGSPKKLCLA